MPQIKLGNDIVDLLLARSYSKKFLARVFSFEEQTSILNNPDNNTILWAIWAAKEAAYKALKKILPELIFSHNKFNLTQQTLINLQNIKTNNTITGVLLYQNYYCHIKWEYNTDFIHCIAVYNKLSSWEIINYNITDISTNAVSIDHMRQCFTQRELSSIFTEQSLKTRFYAKEFLKLHNFDANIEIVRFNNNPPMLLIKEQQLINNDISLSHDGRFVAFAFI
jgi:phosphopantetheinyl transferase (holo-ACP synthase)